MNTDILQQEGSAYDEVTASWFDSYCRVDLLRFTLNKRPLEVTISPPPVGDQQNTHSSIKLSLFIRSKAGYRKEKQGLLLFSCIFQLPKGNSRVCLGQIGYVWDGPAPPPVGFPKKAKPSIPRNNIHIRWMSISRFKSNANVKVWSGFCGWIFIRSVTGLQMAIDILLTDTTIFSSIWLYACIHTYTVVMGLFNGPREDRK